MAEPGLDSGLAGIPICRNWFLRARPGPTSWKRRGYCRRFAQGSLNPTAAIQTACTDRWMRACPPSVPLDSGPWPSVQASSPPCDRKTLGEVAGTRAASTRKRRSIAPEFPRKSKTRGRFGRAAAWAYFRNSQVPTAAASKAPASWPRRKPGASPGWMPAGVSVNMRAKLITGLAKEVEAVNQ